MKAAAHLDTVHVSQPDDATHEETNGTEQHKIRTMMTTRLAEVDHTCRAVNSHHPAPVTGIMPTVKTNTELKRYEPVTRLADEVDDFRIRNQRNSGVVQS